MKISEESKVDFWGFLETNTRYISKKVYRIQRLLKLKHLIAAKNGLMCWRFCSKVEASQASICKLGKIQWQHNEFKGYILYDPYQKTRIWKEQRVAIQANDSINQWALKSYNERWGRRNLEHNPF